MRAVARSAVLIHLLLAIPAFAQDLPTVRSYPDPALEPPPARTEPGQEYYAWTRMYQGMPTIERARDGRLWAAWTAGGVNEGPFNYVVLATSADDGARWSDPVLVIDPPGNVSALVPILWHDPMDRLWLFWNQGYGAWWDGRMGVWAIATNEPDSSRPTWTAPRRLVDGFMGTKATALDREEWLLASSISSAPPGLAEESEYYGLGLSPAAIEALTHDLGDRKGANIYRSLDGGASWDLSGQIAMPAAPPAEWGNVAIEHMVVERLDGTLWALLRTGYGIGQSFSGDGGVTWTPMAPSGIRHPVTRFFIRRLQSGALLMIRHDPPSVEYPEGCDDCGEDNRSHLKAYLSGDDGATWYGGLMLDERERVSYPDAVQGRNGSIYVVYDRHRYTEREILLARFREEDVAAGLCVTSACRLQHVIDKAGPW